MAVRIAIVTCRDYPALSASDRLYRAALERRGAETRAVVWTAEDVFDALDGTDGIVLRSPWDYPHDLAGFRRFVDGVERRSLRLFNAPALVRWNMDKRYLLDLAGRGIAVPSTRVIEAEAQPDALRAAMADLGLGTGERAVVKPAWGGSGSGVVAVTQEDAAEGLARLRAEAPGRPLLVQPLLSDIARFGETSLVFVGGVFAHAIVKRPADGEFRINTRYQPRPPERVTPSPDLVAQAEAVLAALPGEAPLYARIDGVVDAADRFICIEAEAIDPALAMDLAPETAEALAEETLGRILAPRTGRS